MDKDNQVTDSQFEDFWRASEFDDYNIKDFANLQEAYSATEKPVSIIEYPQQPIKLPKTKNAVRKISQNRLSQRSFSDKILSLKSLASILSAFDVIDGLEHRTYPSAGAVYALETFVVCFNVDKFSQRILYYNPDQQAVTNLAPALPWIKVANEVNVLVSGMPQMLILFVIDSHRQVAKYGERGGRFALIEVGAALQQLALQITADKKLLGVAAGGLKDRYWLKALGLDASRYKIALGYLCGQ